MRKKFFLLIAILCFVMCLSACSCGGDTIGNNNQNANTSGTGTTGTTGTTEIAEVAAVSKAAYDAFCAEYKLVVKNDNYIAPTLGAQKDCEFAGYLTYKETEQSTTGILNIYGKVFNSTNTYNSYIKMSYVDVELDNIFTQNRATDAENKIDWYTNLKSFIPTATYDHDRYAENKVNSFSAFNTAAKTLVPNTTNRTIGTLDSVDVKMLNEGDYESEFSNYHLFFYTENIYKCTETVNGQEQIVKNATIMKVHVTLKITDTEYEQYKDTPEYFIDKFIECTTNPDLAWRVTTNIMGVVEREVNGADMSIEI